MKVLFQVSEAEKIPLFYIAIKNMGFGLHRIS
jgi:hypothetical protein